MGLFDSLFTPPTPTNVPGGRYQHTYYRNGIPSGSVQSNDPNSPYRQDPMAQVQSIVGGVAGVAGSLIPGGSALSGVLGTVSSLFGGGSAQPQTGASPPQGGDIMGAISSLLGGGGGGGAGGALSSIAGLFGRR